MAALKARPYTSGFIQHFITTCVMLLLRSSMDTHAPRQSCCRTFARVHAPNNNIYGGWRKTPNKARGSTVKRTVPLTQRKTQKSRKNFAGIPRIDPGAQGATSIPYPRRLPVGLEQGISEQGSVDVALGRQFMKLRTENISLDGVPATTQIDRRGSLGHVFAPTLNVKRPTRTKYSP